MTTLDPRFSCLDERGGGGGAWGGGAFTVSNAGKLFLNTQKSHLTLATRPESLAYAENSNAQIVYTVQVSGWYSSDTRSAGRMYGSWQNVRVDNSDSDETIKSIMDSEHMRKVERLLTVVWETSWCC